MITENPARRRSSDMLLESVKVIPRTFVYSIEHSETPPHTRPNSICDTNLPPLVKEIHPCKIEEKRKRTILQILWHAIKHIFEKN